MKNSNCDHETQNPGKIHDNCQRTKPKGKLLFIVRIGLSIANILISLAIYIVALLGLVMLAFALDSNGSQTKELIGAFIKSYPFDFFSTIFICCVSISLPMLISVAWHLNKKDGNKKLLNIVIDVLLVICGCLHIKILNNTAFFGIFPGLNHLGTSTSTKLAISVMLIVFGIIDGIIVLLSNNNSVHKNRSELTSNSVSNSKNICPNCHEETKNDNFCTKCGYKLK